jgi:hypothetical protein
LLVLVLVLVLMWVVLSVVGVNGGSACAFQEPHHGGVRVCRTAFVPNRGSNPNQNRHPPCNRQLWCTLSHNVNLHLPNLSRIGVRLKCYLWSHPYMWLVVQQLLLVVQLQHPQQMGMSGLYHQQRCQNHLLQLQLGWSCPVV